MRKLMLGTIATILATYLLGNLALGSSVGKPGMLGTGHDFSQIITAGNASSIAFEEICSLCHTPMANSMNNGIIWNRTITTATFTPYTSLTMNAVPGEPNGISKLCLSCHDGTVAIEAYGNNGTGTHFMKDPMFDQNGSPLIGNNLSDDHPISFLYDTALASSDGALNDPSEALILSGEAGSHSMTGKLSELLDSTGQVQCTSCHDPHNSFGIEKMLKVNNTGSLLCLSCHNK